MEILLQLFVAICMFAFVGLIIYIAISATKQSSETGKQEQPKTGTQIAYVELIAL